VDREARAADSDKIRTYCLHGGFRALLKKSGYFHVKSSMKLVAHISALPVREALYRHPDGWHITMGDSDLDR
jgi:hypothetical protein